MDKENDDPIGPIGAFFQTSAARGLDDSRATGLCTYCPKMCRHSCPVVLSNGNERYTPQAKMELLGRLHRREVSWKMDSIPSLYACTGCQLCREYCVHGVDVEHTLWKGRAEARKRSLTHESLRNFPQQFDARHRRLRSQLQKKKPVIRPDDQGFAYFPGCDTVENSPDDIGRFLRIASRVGIDRLPLVVEPRVCFGVPLRDAGYVEEANRCLQLAIAGLRSTRKIIVGCTRCLWVLRTDTRTLDQSQQGYQFLSPAEFLEQYLDRLDIKAVFRHLVYHDPCHLGRKLGVYEPPRHILAKTCRQLSDFFRNRSESVCCGGGGLVPQTFPEVPRNQAQFLLEEADEIGADYIVTACGTCKHMLQKSGSPERVLDLIVALDEAI